MAPSPAKYQAISAAQRECLALCQQRGMDIALHGLRIAAQVEAIVLKLHSALDEQDGTGKLFAAMDKRNPVLKRFGRKLVPTAEQQEALDGLAWAFSGMQAVRLFTETLNEQKEPSHG